MGVSASPRVFNRRELACVLVLLGALALVFTPYFIGRSTPPWDFYTNYLSDPHAWWTRGSFFHPPEWLDYMRSGYPSAVAVQNGGWYLPIGVATWVGGGYTPWVASSLQGAHALWGGLGAYVLLRRMGSTGFASRVAMVAWTLSPGFFNGAQHADYVRGWAWLPWVLLVVSPFWSWKRPWAVPAASVILWQTLIGIYPGQIMAFAISGGAFALASWLSRRQEWRQLVPLLVSGAAALLFAMPKYWPLVKIGTSQLVLPDEQVLGLTELTSVVLPYWDLKYVNDVSMVSFAVPATLVAALALVSWRDRRVWPFAAAGVMSFAVGVPWSPLYAAPLPGSSLSRYHLNDHRAVLLLVAVALGALGLERLVTAGPGGLTWARVALPAGGLVVAAAALAVTMRPRHWLLGLAVATGAALAVPLAHGLSRTALRRWCTPLLLTSVAAAGLFAVANATLPWMVPRQDAELTNFGGPVADLLSQPYPTSFVQRPARELPPASNGRTNPFEVSAGNRHAYDRGFAVFGYLNVRNNPVGLDQWHAFKDERSSDLLHFFGAPGALVPLSERHLELSDACLSGACPGLQWTSVRYAPGDIQMDITAPGAMVAALNEPGYLGWSALACPSVGGSCRPVTTGRGPLSALTLDLPAGHWRLHVTYRTPGLGQGWMAFWAGAALAALGAGVGWRRSRRRHD